MAPPQHNERACEKAEVDWLGFYLVPLEDRGMLTMLRAWHEPYPSSSCSTVLCGHHKQPSMLHGLQKRNGND